MKVQEAIDVLVNTYNALDAVAAGLPVDAQEVAEALAEATPDTADFVCLSVLARFNPYIPPKSTKK